MGFAEDFTGESHFAAPAICEFMNSPSLACLTLESKRVMGPLLPPGFQVLIAFLPPK
jgi:hypothetical protein